MSKNRSSILAFDCAGKALSVTVVTIEGKVLSTIFEELRFGHSARLMPMIDQSLSQAGVGYRDLGLIATTRGPGGFTGLRVGIATARSLAQALSIPVLGFSSFETNLANLPMSFEPQRKRLVVIDSHRNDLYFQWFNSDCSALTEPSILSLGAISTLIDEGQPLVLGNGRTLLGNLPAENHDGETEFLNLSKQVANLALQAVTNQSISLHPCDPIYLRAADVTLSSKVN
jgi:tRNA threonylcarbamoyladenosine biosynthesis protein TsaB